MSDQVSDSERQVAECLESLGITWQRYVHPPVRTAEEGETHWAGIDALHSKNLFLRNQRGDRHYLLVVVHSKRVNLRAVADQIGDGKLSFASPERLATYLGVAPGSVSPFGLIHDRKRQVRVFLDRDMAHADRVSFHPNINTATYVLARRDFEAFLASRGNAVRYVDVVSAATSSPE